MSKELEKLQPSEVWENFYKLTQVPRPSNHEEKARKFMLEWAKEHHVEAKKDKAGNIIMSKPAAKGMENRKGIILQAHLDMVPQKNEDVAHKFETDPIQAYVDGEWVKAKGTTLGADNGIGVASAMGILASDTIQHGPIEVLITATEETGMDGANGLKPGVLKGDILLNLDSETEGELYVGCAGGIDASVKFVYDEKDTPEDYVAYRIAVKNLKGGHSGMDINLGRGNSNKILSRFIKTYAGSLKMRIASIEGGSLRNAIPRESFATIALPKNKIEALENVVKEAEAIYRAEIIEKDPELSLSIEKTKLPKKVMSPGFQKKFVNALIACPNGPVRMIDSMPDTVETSNNMAIVKAGKGEAVVYTMVRSSVESAKEALMQNIEAVFELAGADTIEFLGDYPGWNPNPSSPILSEMRTIYKKMFGKMPGIKAVHAGLECGILGANYPHWDMISFGPTIKHPHSPDEKVSIESVKKFWDFLLEILKNAPEK